jgi:hypothetical protein
MDSSAIKPRDRIVAAADRATAAAAPATSLAGRAISPTGRHSQVRPAQLDVETSA